MILESFYEVVTKTVFQNQRNTVVVSKMMLQNQTESPTFPKKIFLQNVFERVSSNKRKYIY